MHEPIHIHWGDAANLVEVQYGFFHRRCTTHQADKSDAGNRTTFSLVAVEEYRTPCQGSTAKKFKYAPALFLANLSVVDRELMDLRLAANPIIYAIKFWRWDLMMTRTAALYDKTNVVVGEQRGGCGVASITDDDIEG